MREEIVIKKESVHIVQTVQTDRKKGNKTICSNNMGQIPATRLRWLTMVGGLNGSDGFPTVSNGAKNIIFPTLSYWWWQSVVNSGLWQY
jgi:hypothetical protein